MNGIMKIIKLFEESGLFIKSISETIKTEAKEKKKEYLCASSFGNLSTGKGKIRAG